ncbi:hypothetical protein B0H17DRAFT_1140224 [Mycena rosella]|uniref:Uncharacterized protein n=1 Tax=Mycena rosella TaxID=1033263 RepID=A0AAD7D309_MYCRO|nr:hypothetical protein B0H17DRAFT_1140224 [Mycena rosella]
MLKELAKWPRKRPREPGGPGTSIKAPVRQPSELSRNRFTLFRKKEVVAQETQPASAPSEQPERRPSRSALDVTAFTAKMLLAACDVPVLNILKPVAGLADLWLQQTQAVRNNKEAAARLERKAAHVADLVIRSVALGSVVGEKLEEILRTLEEIALYSDSIDPTVCISDPKFKFASNSKRKLKSWLLATQEQDRIESLDARLDDALAIFTAATNLSTRDDLARLQNQLDSHYRREDRITLQNVPPL